jgi:thiol-disulfide isomerase/thioredoxin
MQLKTLNKYSKMCFKKTPGSVLFIAILLIGIVGRYLYKRPYVDTGEMAPAISGQLPDGRTFELAELKGNFVLVDFWGSWCGPCRAENPALVALYKKYEGAVFKNAKGFTIVSVGIEKEEARWKRTIQTDQLYWPYHVLDKVSNYKFFDAAIAKSYGVTEVPTKFLLNTNLETIEVNPSLEQLDKFLEGELE